MNTSPHISIVSPEYNGAVMVPELVQRIKKSVGNITEDYEIILVNDASPDDTWQAIHCECEKDCRVKGLDLSKNYGQHHAISAGLAYARGEWVVVMDCDLQDPPEEIVTLYKKAMDGFDIVVARRTVKYVGWWKKMSSVCFHWFFNLISGAKTKPDESNFSIINRKVVDAYNKIPMYSRAYGIIISILGFKKEYVDMPQESRKAGSSGYTLKKLFSFATTVIVSTTNRPLRIAVTLGFLMSTISFFLAIYNVIAKLVGIIHVAGYTTTIFSIWFVGGLLLCVLGILGLYIGRIFDQVKGLPIYVVREDVNF